jgi:hypothetical protein
MALPLTGTEERLMSINRVICSVVISSYGSKISWTESGKLVVTCFAVERLIAAPVAAASEA